MIRRRLLFEKNEDSGSVNNLLDVVFYNTSDSKIYCVSKDDIDNVADTYKPIGIVIIPQSHDVYGDGSSCVMALKPIHLKTSSTGFIGSDTNLTLIEFGGYKASYELGITPIPNTTKMTITAAATYSRNILTITDIPFIVSNNIVTEMKYDTFFKTSHAFNKFGPLEHNKFVEAADSVNSQWKTCNDSTFYSLVSGNDLMFYAGPLCAHRYKTPADNNVGNWYYPDNGEILYVWCNTYEIIQIMNKLKSKYGDTFCIPGYTWQTFTPFLYRGQTGYYLYCLQSDFDETPSNVNSFMVGHGITYSPIGSPLPNFTLASTKIGPTYAVRKMKFE